MTTSSQNKPVKHRIESQKATQRLNALISRKGLKAQFKLHDHLKALYQYFDPFNFRMLEVYVRYFNSYNESMNHWQPNSYHRKDIN